MAINVTTAEGRYNLSRLAGSDKIRDELESIFSQATSNPDLYQQFQTVFDRIAPASSFDKLSINRQSVLTARAVREFLKQQAFDKRLKASLEGLSPALQDELTTKLGALGDYKITAQQRGRLLTQFERKTAKARREEIANNANTAKIGIFNVKGTFANIWETTLGRAVFAPLNRHVLQPIASGHETRMKQAAPFMKTLFWAGIAALGVAAVVATGGLVLAGSLPAIAGLAVGGIATAVAVNKARHAGTEFLYARANAVVAQDARDKAFRAQNDAYQNGSPEASRSLEQHSIVATLSGVRESDFAGSGATLNVSSGQVVLSPEMYKRYHGRVDVAFERSGTLKVAITDPTMNDQDIKQAIADVYADCTNGKVPESIMVRAGAETTSFDTLEALGQAETNFAEEAQKARDFATAEADTENLNKKINAKLTDREFMDSAVCAALAASVGNQPMDDEAYVKLISEKLAKDLGVEEQALDGTPIRPYLNSHFSTYYNRGVENDQNALIPAAAASAAIVGLPENSSPKQFVSKFVEVTGKENIPELACMAAVVGTGLNKEQIGELQTVIKAVKELQPEEELSNEIKTTAQSVAQAMSISQDNLIAEIRNGLNPVPASPEEEQATTSFFEKIQELARA
jgi:hypothetical protein